MTVLNSTQVPVAIVGGGSIAPFHAKYILISPNCELVAIIDPFPSGQALAERLSVRHFKTAAELEASVAVTRKPQLFFICVPNALHVPLATEVLRTCPSAKVILVEKPLSTDSASAVALLSAASSLDSIIAVGHHRRFHPRIVAASDAITSGRLGAITAIQGSWCALKDVLYFDRDKFAWRASRAAGGGPVWTNFVHDIDLLQYLVGAGVRRVWAVKTPSQRNHRHVAPGDEIEEGATIMFQFSNSVVGTFVVSDNAAGPYNWEACTGENPLLPQADVPTDCFRVFGTRGSLSVPDLQLWSYPADSVDEGWQAPMTREVLDVVEGIPFQRQVEHLARVARGLEKPVCRGVDGLAAVRVCEAVVRALDKGDGMPVDIDIDIDIDL